MKITILVYVLTFLSISVNLLAQPDAPILRLNTEMHTDKIRRISIDAEGKYLLSVSDDKTAKLWDAQSGKLLQTFRPDIGYGFQGMLYAGSLSPNGKIAAVSGYTSRNGLQNSIYFYSTQTGDLLFIQDKVPGIVNDLEFSRDGVFLAAAQGGTAGVIVYKIGGEQSLSVTQEKSLSGYRADVYNVDWDNSGRLATASFDGKLRLYDRDFNLIAWKSGSGQRPFSVAFSPDGSKIAVGYEDISKIEVRSGQDLEVLYEPSNAGAVKTEDRINKLCFSADGKQLYGGGYYSGYVDGNMWKVIRHWKDAGQGAYKDFPACDNTLMDIKAVPGKASNPGYPAVVYCGGQPDFGMLDTNGKQVLYRNGKIYNFLNFQYKYLKINQTGEEIAFLPAGETNINFSVKERIIRQADAPAEFLGFSDKSNGLEVTNWINSTSPAINGQAVTFFQRFEKCRSTDVSGDGKNVVLGTNWNLHCAAPDGKLLWKRAVEATVWAVKISGNGKVLVATLSGGLINWYSMENGDKLLSLYVNPETQKWVLFTPNGYYDASPGADRNIGWHLNGKPNEGALFFQASKFRNKYYRPTVIDEVLHVRSEQEALQLADNQSGRDASQTDIKNMLPPVVSIVSPSHNAEVIQEEIEIVYTAKSPGGEQISDIKFLIDGRPLQQARGFKAIEPKDQYRKKITIPQHDVSIQFLAANEHGWSSVAEIQIKWRGETINPDDILKPTLYVLSIGVSDYANNEYDLNYAAKDAGDFADVMKIQKGGLYKDVVVRQITNTQATRGNILDGLSWIEKETTSRDMAMIFLAGHGINDNVGVFYYMPHDADIGNMRRTCVKFDELKHTTSVIAGKVIMFVDACHSGNVMGGRRAIPDVNSLVNELSEVESGVVVFTSSTGKQFSLEDSSWENGAFTEALLEGMNGGADWSKNGIITVKGLDLFIAEKVKFLTDGKQSPTVVIPQSISNFPIGILR